MSHRLVLPRLSDRTKPVGHGPPRDSSSWVHTPDLLEMSKAAILTSAPYAAKVLRRHHGWTMWDLQVEVIVTGLHRDRLGGKSGFDPSRGSLISWLCQLAKTRLGHLLEVTDHWGHEVPDVSGWDSEDDDDIDHGTEWPR